MLPLKLNNIIKRFEKNYPKTDRASQSPNHLIERILTQNIYGSLKDQELISQKKPINIQKFLLIKLRKKYNAKTNFYDKKKVNELIFNFSSHYTAEFKEYLIREEEAEFIKRFYYKRELPKKLKHIFFFYENYSKIFPNYTVIKEGKYMYKNILKKQKMIDQVQNNNEKNNLNKNKSDNGKKNKKNKSNTTIFTEGAMDSIYSQSDSFFKKNLLNLICLDLEDLNDEKFTKNIEGIVKKIDSCESQIENRKKNKKQSLYMKEIKNLHNYANSLIGTENTANVQSANLSPNTTNTNIVSNNCTNGNINTIDLPKNINKTSNIKLNVNIKKLFKTNNNFIIVNNNNMNKSSNYFSNNSNNYNISNTNLINSSNNNVNNTATNMHINLNTNNNYYNNYLNNNYTNYNRNAVHERFHSTNTISNTNTNTKLNSVNSSSVNSPQINSKISKKISTNQVFSKLIGSRNSMRKILINQNFSGCSSPNKIPIFTARNNSKHGMNHNIKNFSNINLEIDAPYNNGLLTDRMHTDKSEKNILQKSINSVLRTNNNYKKGYYSGNNSGNNSNNNPSTTASNIRKTKYISTNENVATNKSGFVSPRENILISNSNSSKITNNIVTKYAQTISSPTEYHTKQCSPTNKKTKIVYKSQYNSPPQNSLKTSKKTIEIDNKKNDHKKTFSQKELIMSSMSSLNAINKSKNYNISKQNKSKDNIKKKILMEANKKVSLIPPSSNNKINFNTHILFTKTKVHYNSKSNLFNNSNNINNNPFKNRINTNSNGIASGGCLTQRDLLKGYFIPKNNK